MHLREMPTRTLDELHRTLHEHPVASVRALNATVNVALADEDEEKREIHVGTKTLPATHPNLIALAAWTEVPKAFLLRQPPEFQETILNYRLQHTAGEIGIFRVADKALLEVRPEGRQVIEPISLIEAMMGAVGEDGIVGDFWSNAEDFRLDAMVAPGTKGHEGGDAKSKVPGPDGKRIGDITRGGVRITQNRKQNHAPEVSEWYFRLACTNGMEIAEEGDKIDARGQSVDDILVHLELTARRIMDRHEERIRRFYAMREEPVRSPEQAVIRIADEHGITPRVFTSIIREVPEVETVGDEWSMFDVVNLVTNFANDPAIARRAGASLLLERAGGAVVHEHATRCAHCQSKLR